MGLIPVYILFSVHRCHVGLSLRVTTAAEFSSRSTGSRDLLQWGGVSLQQQRSRLFVPKAEVAA